MQEGPLVQQQQQRRTFSPPANSSIKKNVSKTKDKNAFAVQVLRSLYGLKQSGRIWYKRFKAKMLALGFNNDDLAPCLLMKQTNKEFVVIDIYVDDINIFGTANLTAQIIETLKQSCEMKDIGMPSYCLGVQFDHLPRGIFISQSTYTKKIIKQFNMQNTHPVSMPMDLRSLDPTKDIFKRRMEHQLILGPEKPYLSAIGALMYLANQTRPDISFAVSLLARHSAQLTIRHWNGIKRIFRYLQGTVDKGLYFPKVRRNEPIGFADAGYLSDPDDTKSQTGYIFLQGTTAISWKSSKQTLTTTSSNHAEVIALYEACRECVWLRQLIDHINKSTGKPLLNKPTTIYEDNRPCVDQIAQGFIKGDQIKHIAPKFFYTHEQNGDQIKVEWIPSKDNCADLFTKPLPPSLHKEHSHGIGMRKLSSLLESE
jgi:hypothetical protein